MKEELLSQAVSSVEFYLNPDILRDQSLLRQISDKLKSGGLVVIRNAFQASFAERAFACLDGFSDWKLYEGYEEHFHYRHHNIYDEKLFPLTLIQCREVFDSEGTKRFMRNLTERECAGPVTLGASFYQPGDHSLPHNDFIEFGGHERQVAFIWNLTKDWQADWGGEFFWCKKGRSIPSRFNSLLLFGVDRSSMHFVTMVAPHAKGKRLAISGWWTSKGIEERASIVSRDESDEMIEFV